MNVRQMYERVSMYTQTPERQFFNWLNDTLAELGGLYGEVPKLLHKQDSDVDGAHPMAAWVTELDSEVTVLPLYHPAIVDNILHLAGAGEHYKGEFLRKAHDAWLKYWNQDAKNRRVKQSGGRGCRCVR